MNESEHNRSNGWKIGVIVIAVLVSSSGFIAFNSDASPGVLHKSTISITLQSSSIQLGESVHASCILTGSSKTKPISGAEISLAIALPDEEIAYPNQGAKTVTTSSGEFYIDYTPLYIGSYKLTVSFSGNAAYKEITESVIFDVLDYAPSKSASSITLAFGTSSIETGSNLHTNGSLVAASPIVGAAVNLQVILPDGSSVYPEQGASTVTDSQGLFCVDYIPTIEGTYGIKAAFSGNDQYNGSSVGISFTATNPIVNPTPVPKLSSTLDLTVTSTSAEIGVSVHAYGLLSSSLLMPGASVDLQVILPNGTIDLPVQGATVITDFNGAFDVDYTPSTSGIYEFRAVFNGNTTYEGCSASTEFSAVTPLSPVRTASSITLMLDSSTITVGTSVHASGRLTSLNGIPGASVSLNVTLPDGSSTYPAQGSRILTDSSGNFVIDFVPSVPGVYEFIASFDGDANYLGSMNEISFNAVAQIIPPNVDPLAFDYRVSNNKVFDSSGTAVYTASTFTPALQWATLQANKRIYVPSGIYALTSHVYLASGSCLFGDGSATTITSTGGYKIRLHSAYGGGGSDSSIHDIRFTGSTGIQILIQAGLTTKNVIFSDIIMENISSSVSSCFQIWGNAGSVTDGVTFKNCSCINTGCIAFLLTGEKTTNPAIHKNVRFEDCIASHCGSLNSHYNDWVVGYDFNEASKVENLAVIRCVAEYCWEAGFHFETAYQPSGTTLFKDCISNYNGQKPLDHVNYVNGVQQSPNGPWYSSGYFLGRSVWNLKTCLVGCTAIGNIPGHFGSWDPVTQVKYGLS